MTIPSNARIIGFALCATLLLGLCSTGMAQAPSPSANRLVIRNARIFDGKMFSTGVDVWVQDGQIKALGKNLKVPADVKIIDATGDTLLPGFIDSHTHAWGDALRDALIFGVTTELDMFTDPDYAANVKKEQAEGKELNMADLRSAGYLATVPGGHGTEYGIPVPTLTSPDEAQAWVDARIAEGSDYIKIVYDDASAYGGHRPTLSKAAMKAVIDAAHKRGKLAVVHIGDQQGAKDAIDAGADGLAHLFADSAPTMDFVPLLAAHHAFVIPTLTVLESVSGVPSGVSLITDPRFAPYLTLENIANLKRTFPKFPKSLSEKYAEDAVRELLAAHVPVLAGTDSPNPGTSHGASIHRELELLVRSGMSPEQALAAATSVPARVFHLNDRGEIAPGKRADLLLVKGDPTDDITVTRDIVAVWKAGEQDDRETFRAEIAKQKEQAVKAQSAPAPSGSESGTVSDFESGKPDASFGSGWSISTDRIAGGKSTGTMNVVADGANGSEHSLDGSGYIDGGLSYAWAGVMFSPGSRPFAPVNLSAKKNLSFWAKGDGKTYRAMIFTQSGGRMPAIQTFTAGREWKQFTLPLSAFDGTDGHDITAILFVGGPQAGKFDFQIDEFRLQ
ncbi:MAG: CIA30 family protein [Terriglobales bacterium]